MRINFSGSVWDSSGYGEFSRYFIYALHKAGVSVSVEPIALEVQDLDFGTKGELCKKLIGGGQPDVNVINMIPNLFRKHRRPGCVNIGFTMWEASRTPPIWAKLCNEMDAIFVPCIYNKKVFEDSGVTVPIFIVPPGIEEEKVSILSPMKRGDDGFSFYSIFQWLERKNPKGLLKAYLSEFSRNDNVKLVIKTYSRAKADNNEIVIKKLINEVVSSMNIKSGELAKVELVTSLLTDQEMGALHDDHDCFVLPFKSEGWCLPAFEAMLHAKPVIATNFSGAADFLSTEHSYPLNYTMTPCTNEGALMHSWYNGKMWWAEADLEDLAKKMRHVYENRLEAAAKGKKAQDFVVNNFSSEATAETFVEAVKEVLNGK